MSVPAGQLGSLAEWSPWLLGAGAAAALAGWLALLRVGGRGRAWGRAPLAVVRIALAAAGVWLAIQLIGRGLLLTTRWPLWPVALLAAAGAEGAIWLYELERRVVSRRMGRTLTALRVLLLALVVGMLIQPVIALAFTETRKRTLAVLLDASASMGIADGQLPPHERLRLAEAFSVPAARRPYRLDDHADALHALREELVAELGRVDRLARSDPQLARRQLAGREKDLRQKLLGWADLAANQADGLQSVLTEFARLPQPMRAALMDGKATLGKEVRDRLKSAAARTGGKQAGELPAELDRLGQALRRAAEGLAQAEAIARRAGSELDGMMYRMLGQADRAAVDAVAALSRQQLATAALIHKPTPTDPDAGGGQSLLDALGGRYDVKVYTFAGAPAEADARSWADPFAAGAPAAATGPSTAPAKATPESMRTDLAAGLRKVLSDAGDLAGVVMLSDGQDNGPDSPEPLARQLGARGAGFWAVLAGCETPPADAGIIAVESPDTVTLGDRMYANVELKLDGLGGRRVHVSLHDGERVVDTREIRVRGEASRRRVQLADEPREAGMHGYRVQVRPDPAGGAVAEAFADNNAFALAVSVTKEKAKVLLIESRPRWEFRYLKNLFTGRDKTVRLQYVLTRPDRFFGQPAGKPVPASAARPEGAEEANALPTTEPEWMKFDLIVLGDVSPADLARCLPAEARKAAGGRPPDAEAVRILRKFVTDRGGTLVLIAGPAAMPGKYAGTGLAELIPVRTAAAATSPAARPAKAGFRIALTDAGEEHVILRQDVDAGESRQVWGSLPAIYWHSRCLQAHPAAAVLAYALPAKPPAWLTGPADDPHAQAERLRRRRQYHRRHALLLAATHGLGKILMLNFDRTWRLRYRVGDSRHHKFWGQVVRWATAGKLPAGTAGVRLGTDKTRYQGDDRPVVRAKIVREDFSPVVTDQVAVVVLADGKPIRRAPMEYVQDSPGLYTATLEALPAGNFRLEMDAPAAKELLGADAEPVRVEISVAPSAPAEQVDLAANRHLLNRLAELSDGGGVFPAYKARRVLERLPAGTIRERHEKEFRLWDSWLLLGLFCAAVTAEWILRKKAGLA